MLLRLYNGLTLVQRIILDIRISAFFIPQEAHLHVRIRTPPLKLKSSLLTKLLYDKLGKLARVNKNAMMQKNITQDSPGSQSPTLLDHTGTKWPLTEGPRPRRYKVLTCGLTMRGTPLALSGDGGTAPCPCRLIMTGMFPCCDTGILCTSGGLPIPRGGSGPPGGIDMRFFACSCCIFSIIIICCCCCSKNE